MLGHEQNATRAMGGRDHEMGMSKMRHLRCVEVSTDRLQHHGVNNQVPFCALFAVVAPLNTHTLCRNRRSVKHDLAMGVVLVAVAHSRLARSERQHARYPQRAVGALLYMGVNKHKSNRWLLLE